MLERINPDGVAAPLSNYSHVVVVPEGMKQLHISGQIGMAPDGTISPDVETQGRQTYANIRAILASQGLTLEDLVSLTIYVVGKEHLPAVRAARVAELGELAPASTLVFVSALAAPEIKVEIQAIAASPA